MVQSRDSLRQGDFLPSTKESNWHPVERAFLDPTQDARFTVQSSPIHTRALSIEASLRDCVRLPVKEFALIVHLENGVEKTYTSQSLTPWQPQIFGDRFRQDFRRSLCEAAAEIAYAGSTYREEASIFPELDTQDCRKFSSSGDSSSGGRSRHPYYRKSRSDHSDGADSSKGKRKRVRGATQYSLFDNEDVPIPVPVVKSQQIIIGDEAQVENFYATRFKDMQQSSCKVMGKVFVKLVEPKKQTHHPYTKGDDKAPPWWPKTSGDNHVRHREPDHLLRHERIRLLVHVLKMIVQPVERQCEAVRKSNLNIQKLEDVTMEAMSAWFNDSEHPGNLAKKPILKEIFKVAKIEERYRKGEIDADTQIPVSCDDRSGANLSDDEAEESVKDEDEEINTNQIPTSMPTPDSLISQPIIQTQNLQQSQEHESNNMFIEATRPLTTRYRTQPVLEESSSYANSSFLPQNVPVTVGFQSQSPNQQDLSRRSFGSPVYAGPQSLYSWQNTAMVSSGNVNSSYYATSPQTPLGHQSPPFQLLPPPATQQPMLPPPMLHNFDGSSTGRHFGSGTTMGSVVRTGSLGHPHHMPPSLQNYLHDSEYSNNSEARDEQHLHHH